MSAAPTGPATLPPGTLDTLARGRELHLDHYGRRLPFALLGGTGLRQRYAELEGERAGAVFEALDASGGYASACLGAGHEVVRRALDRGTREAGYATDEIGSLERSALLTEVLGEGGLWTDHFPAGEYHASGRNSGSEGMELALRLALETRFDHRTLRPATGRGERDRILAFEGAWHGWTSGLVPFLNRRHYRLGLPVPDPSRPYGTTVDHLPFGDETALAGYLSQFGDRLLAVVVEPIQGDAGILTPPPGYLRSLAERTRRAGALLIADEVLTFAKSGRFFAMADDEGPVPTDITVIGKSIGMGAQSVSMVIARKELTVRGSGAVATSDLRPLGCAVIRDGLRHIVDEKLLEHSAALGEQFTAALREEAVAAFPELYREIRGRGVIQGLELTEAAAGRLVELREHIVRAGVMVEFMAGAGRRSAGLRYVFPTLRIAPPLITGPREAEEIVARIAEGSRAFLGRPE
ncbi:acetylornithine/acetyl-lysine aminotransferase [Streptomyces inusitatus]|uniref:Acetylornithine/acetyl-lysine aminotransferase n=1 Tax=Streptomyces inusitatus TaxID=68221 RepID=A0A918V0H7_9ACTN|nr:aminotransferase class III-fold pyridoxal phosphate-dependent enzyme [Streptomyces inusitatus]GGZ48788.1 acetylornithine/acetyl-lysine aminotransferase [Streptomyces inusitatus]